MYRFASSLAASAVLVFLGMAALGTAIAPAPAPKIIATVVAHAHPASVSDWVASTAHGL
jgi:hypothetical protein